MKNRRFCYAGVLNVGKALMRIFLFSLFMAFTPLVDITATSEQLPSADVQPVEVTENDFSAEDRKALQQGKYFLSERQFDKYRNLREEWQLKTEFSSEWFFLDAEEFLLLGQRENAISLLSSHTFTGNAETERLVRLAALHILEAPSEAWNYLEIASTKDSNNADLHTFKAALLDSHNKQEKAAKEYILAVQKNENNPYLKEQLADFYLRNCQYPQATEALKSGLNSPSLSTIWIKALFWSRMTSPITFAGFQRVPTDQLTPFLVYLNTLPKEGYWDSKAFAKLSDKDLYLATQQETFWLRLFALLKNQDEAGAEALLNNNSFRSTSWAPQLEDSLKTVLAYRRAINHDLDGTEQSNLESSKEQFLEILVALSGRTQEKGYQEELHASLPNDLHELLLNKDVFSIACLAQGWKEAALQFQTNSEIPANYPSWIAFEFTNAYLDNRSKEEALAFATKQPSSPRLSLLIAEMYIDSGRTEEAYQVLLPLYQATNDLGGKASLLIAPLFLSKNEFKLARDALINQPSLANSVPAREVLARVFFEQGDPEVAYRLYLSIQEYSPEAKSFLARKAFAEADWIRAYHLTEELIEIYPDNITLRDNLKSIPMRTHVEVWDKTTTKKSEE